MAATGPDALTAALTTPPWMVLLDIGLPHMDGWTVADRLRSALGESCRLVLMSGQRTNPERARLLGAADWLSKPFGVGDLLACIGRSAPRGLAAGPRGHNLAICNPCRPDHIPLACAGTGAEDGTAGQHDGGAFRAGHGHLQVLV
ncbi:MAG: response regulator transcription factor [Bacillota bacterium]